MRESEVLDFHQRNGENMKKAWDRISEAHQTNMPLLPIRIVLRNFYFGLFKWCKHSLDLIAEGEFLECDEDRALEILQGLSSYFVYDGLDTIIDRIATIEKKLDALDFKEVGKLKPPKKETLEIEDGWDPMIKIKLNNFSFFALCYVGASTSVMPKRMYDML